MAKSGWLPEPTTLDLWKEYEPDYRNAPIINIADVVDDPSHVWEVAETFSLWSLMFRVVHYSYRWSRPGADNPACGYAI